MNWRLILVWIKVIRHKFWLALTSYSSVSGSSISRLLSLIIVVNHANWGTQTLVYDCSGSPMRTLLSVRRNFWLNLYIEYFIPIWVSTLKLFVSIFKICWIFVYRGLNWRLPGCVTLSRILRWILLNWFRNKRLVIIGVQVCRSISWIRSLIWQLRITFRFPFISLIGIVDSSFWIRRDWFFLRWYVSSALHGACILVLVGVVRLLLSTKSMRSFWWIVILALWLILRIFGVLSAVEWRIGRLLATLLLQHHLIILILLIELVLLTSPSLIIHRVLVSRHLYLGLFKIYLN